MEEGVRERRVGVLGAQRSVAYQVAVAQRWMTTGRG